MHGRSYGTVCEKAGLRDDGDTLKAPICLLNLLFLDASCDADVKQRQAVAADASCEPSLACQSVQLVEVEEIC